jgi:large subunit ribosomal protein L25
MEASLKVKAELRAGVGSSGAKKLRRESLVPAVLYGKGMGTKAITVRRSEITSLLEHGHRLVSVEVGGEEIRAVIKAAQYDTLGEEIIHADFHKVVAGEKMKLMVEVLLVGEAAGVKLGGILEQPTRAVQVECTIESLVELLEMDISGLEIGDALHARDIELPAGVKMLDEPDEVVVSVTAPREEEEEEVEEKEPEVIGEAEKGEEGQEGEAGEEKG